ncbi:MAG: hypothetical protein B7Y39_10700 [Bdellovibrio sp. 28-41-41]|nr:MAG: hypothetical protein B7Y39_10700 [Bdellovibrio sp. 28-41-41]
MKKVILYCVSLMLGSASFVQAASLECLDLYKGKNEIELRATWKKESDGRARIEWGKQEVKVTRDQIRRKKLQDDLFFPMFVRAFEIEFGMTMESNHKEIYKKILFEPEALTATEKDLLDDGLMGEGPQRNADGSPVQHFLNWNHLINKNHEHAAERILRDLRKDSNLQLTQLQLTALRVSRLIDRDYDLFIGTEFEKFANEGLDVRRKRFLDIFEFGGGGVGARRDQQVESGEGFGNIPKKLTDIEYQALRDGLVLRDDPFAEGRFDIEQSYDANFITKKMIQTANERKILASRQWENSLSKGQHEEISKDPILLAAQNKLNRLMKSDSDFAEAIEWTRRLADRVLSKEKNFDTFAEFKDWLNAEKTRVSEIVETLKKDDVEEYAEVFLEGIDKNSQLKGHVSKLKKKIERSKDMDLAFKTRAMAFLDSPLAKTVFFLAKEELQLSGKLKYSNLLEMAESRQKHFETIVDLQRKDPAMLSVIYRTKIVLYAANEAEVGKIFKILSTNSVTRLQSLVVYDPKSQFGFCFGRAFIFELIARKFGIHPTSTRKIYVYGEMSGGLYGWQWHVAHMVAKEGGGFWVLDPSHGRPQTVEEWMATYKEATKDGRIRMFVAPANRFGRSGFEIPDHEVLFSNYNSVWNKVTESMGIKRSYFKDAVSNLSNNQFSGERKNFFERMYDQAMELTLGF